LKAALGLGTITLGIPYVKGDDLDKEIEEFYAALDKIEEIDESKIEVLYNESKDVVDMVKVEKDGIFSDEYKELERISKMYEDYEGITPPYTPEKISFMKEIELDSRSREKFLHVLDSLEENGEIVDIAEMVKDRIRKNNKTTMWDVIYVRENMDPTLKRADEINKIKMVYEQTLSDLKLIRSRPFPITDDKLIGTDELLVEIYPDRVKSDLAQASVVYLEDFIGWMIGGSFGLPIFDFVTRNALVNKEIPDSRAAAGAAVNFMWQTLITLSYDSGLDGTTASYMNHLMLHLLPFGVSLGTNLAECGTKRFNEYRSSKRM
ncbi:MAG: hypothetical protein DRP11_04365, partial [Candidatus Aenigmatarchaeota archaeon]